MPRPVLLGRVVNRYPVATIEESVVKLPSTSAEILMPSTPSPRAEMFALLARLPMMRPSIPMPTEFAPVISIDPSVSRLPVNPDVSKRRMPNESAPSTPIPAVLSIAMLPTKGLAPEINMPVRPVPLAKGPSITSSPSVSVNTVVSLLPTMPVSKRLPVFPPTISIIVASSTSSIKMPPSIVKSLSESSTAAGPVSVMLIAPVAVIMTSSAVPSSPAVDVRTWVSRLSSIEI